MQSLTNIETSAVLNNEEQQRRTWARNLQRWGLSGLASALLESGGAFATLAAQSLYVGQPLLEPWMPARSLATLLEDPQQTQAFVELLREGSQ